MADRIRLPGLPLAVRRRAPQPIGGATTDAVARGPEIRRARLVGRVLHDRAQLSVGDLADHGAAELEVVALLIDRRNPATDDEEDTFDVAEQRVERNVRLGRLERDVWHPWEGHARPVIRDRKSVV